MYYPILPSALSPEAYEIVSRLLGEDVALQTTYVPREIMLIPMDTIFPFGDDP